MYVYCLLNSLSDVCMLLVKQPVRCVEIAC